MRYTKTVTLDVPYEEAIPSVKEALLAQGFGALTEIDMRATLAEKLGAQMEPYLIIGACNPELAHRALQIDPAIGALLPCNVVVRRDAGKTLVEALDPNVMALVLQQEEFEPIAEEADRRLMAAMQALSVRHGGDAR